jgi:putative oxidoreductase
MINIEEGLANWMILFARLCLASVFLISAIHKAFWYQKAVDEFRGVGVPLVALSLPITIALHFFGSLSLIVGMLVTEFSLALAVFTLIVSFQVHCFWRMSGDERLERSRVFEANIAVVGGLVLLAAVGPGGIVL